MVVQKPQQCTFNIILALSVVLIVFLLILCYALFDYKWLHLFIGVNQCFVCLIILN